MFKHFFSALALVASPLALMAQLQHSAKLLSPDEKLVVEITDKGGLHYSVSYDGAQVILPSQLGLATTIGTFGPDANAKGFSVKTELNKQISYDLDRIKQSHVERDANAFTVGVVCADGRRLDVDFIIEDNALAFRYNIGKKGETGCLRVTKELTEFRFPEAQTSTYLTPQSDAMIGWKRTKPSYEEEYELQQPLAKSSKYGHGYTFPCLFHVKDAAWALVSETGVTGRYCASHLSNYVNGAFSVAMPLPDENNGNGNAEPAIALPGSTPWRTISVGKSAAIVANQTITWDVVEPQYQPAKLYSYGRGTWSWILWQDNSINLDDQKRFVDLAKDMGYEYTLVDSYWDKNIGYSGMEDLAAYADDRGVKLFVWYSSSGYWNDITQSPINVMDRSINRKEEMKWLRKIGVAGIKVDFFGGDKQETMRLYEDILSDANDYGLLVVFHGATLPRGWERMYPNYVGSEAVLASENLIFNQHFCDVEAVATATHPFIRNAVGCMEFGGSFMNKRMNKGNNGGNTRRTTDVFEIAQAVLFQNPVQFFALAPNNLTDAPAICMDFLRTVPTTWDETRILDGEPGKYVVMARRKGSKWYVAGVNATNEVLRVSLYLPFALDSKVDTYYDGKDGVASHISSVTSHKPAPTKLSIVPNGGIVLVGQ